MKKPITRRSFISKTASFCGISIVSNAVIAQAMVNENDPQAMALGYKNDGTTVNIVKFPMYASGKRCGTCALFQGRAGDSSGKCPLFAGRQVSAFGWCNAYANRGGLTESTQTPQVSKPQAEVTKPQSIENQNGSNAQHSITTKADASERLTFEVSKQKCEELGFKAATEAFGKCVLQLTK
jgi:hypothetical protein